MTTIEFIIAALFIACIICVAVLIGIFVVYVDERIFGKKRNNQVLIITKDGENNSVFQCGGSVSIVSISNDDNPSGRNERVS